MITKQDLKVLLKKNILNINFNKVDGTNRQMRCSLREDLVPEYQRKTEKPQKPENENIVSVWALEENGFRSFRLDSLVSYEIDTAT